MDPLEYPRSEQVNYAVGAKIYQEDVEIVPPPTTRRRRCHGGGGGGGFVDSQKKKMESFVLPSSTCESVSRRLYKRMHDYYNKFKPEGSNCSQLAIQSRWGAIQRAVNKFCGFKAAVDRRNESRKNEQDRIDDAVKLYEASEPFQFLHCWRMLGNESKWMRSF